MASHRRKQCVILCIRYLTPSFIYTSLFTKSPETETVANNEKKKKTGYLQNIQVRHQWRVYRLRIKWSFLCTSCLLGISRLNINFYIWYSRWTLQWWAWPILDGGACYLVPLSSYKQTINIFSRLTFKCVCDAFASLSDHKFVATYTVRISSKSRADKVWKCENIDSWAGNNNLEVRRAKIHTVGIDSHCFHNVYVYRIT